MRWWTLAAVAAALPAMPAQAADDAVPSCYAAMEIGLVPARPTRELLVFVDQTTPPDPTLRAAVLENVGKLVVPGTAFTVASFSAFSQGKFTTVHASGTLEGPIPPQQRGEIGVPKLRKFDGCLRQQAAYGRKLATSTVATALAGASSGLAKSDVLASLKQLSARAAGSRARDRVVLIVSDMLEHSSTTSFYAKKSLRKIDPQTELDKAGKAGLVGDFGDARIYVIGGAMLPNDGYRGAAELAELEAFWKAWFRGSRAKLVEFGQPNLLRPIR